LREGVDPIGAAGGRPVPGLDVVEVGEVDFPVLVGQLVSEGDPERLEPPSGLVIGPDAVGPDEEEDVRDDRLAVGRLIALDPDCLACHDGDERIRSRAEAGRQLEEAEGDPLGPEDRHPVAALHHDRPAPRAVLAPMRQDRLARPGPVLRSKCFAGVEFFLEGIAF
jgi:hypothetical protein